MVFLEIEKRCVAPECSSYEEREGGVGRLKFVTLRFDFLHLFENRRDLGRTLLEFEPQLGGLRENVALARHIGNEDCLRVPH